MVGHLWKAGCILGMDLEFLVKGTLFCCNTPGCGVRNIRFKKADLIELAEKVEEPIPEDYLLRCDESQANEKAECPPFVL